MFDIYSTFITTEGKLFDRRCNCAYNLNLTKGLFLLTVTM